MTLTLITGPASQTVIAGSAITSITYTLSSTATGATYTGSASGLPSGVSLTISNTADETESLAIILGTPSIIGTYNYSLTVSGSTASNFSNVVVVTGTIIVNPASCLQQHFQQKQLLLA